MSDYHSSVLPNGRQSFNGDSSNWAFDGDEPPEAKPAAPPPAQAVPAAPAPRPQRKAALPPPAPRAKPQPRGLAREQSLADRARWKASGGRAGCYKSLQVRADVVALLGERDARVLSYFLFVLDESSTSGKQHRLGYPRPDGTWWYWEPLDTLAQKIGAISPRVLKRSIARLRKRKLLVVRKMKTRFLTAGHGAVYGPKAINHYQVQWANLLRQVEELRSRLGWDEVPAPQPLTDEEAAAEELPAGFDPETNARELGYESLADQLADEEAQDEEAQAE